MRQQPSVKGLRAGAFQASIGALFSLATLSPASACIDYRQYAHQIAYRTTPNEIHEAALSGDLLCLASPTAFYVLDITNAADPQPLGSLDLAGDPRAIAISGSHAFLASGAAGLFVVGISDPAAPALVAHLDLGAGANDAAVADDHLYIAAGEAGMIVVDIADPASPQIVARLDTPGSALRLDIEGTLAYIADDDADLQLVSVADPLSPVIVRSVDIKWGYASDVVAHDRLIYVVDGLGAIRVIDLSGPSNASPEIRRLPIGGNAERLSETGENVFALGGDHFNSFLIMIDDRESSGPVIVGRLTVRGSLHGFCVDDRYACVAGGWHGYSMVDVSHPVTPKIVGHLTSGWGALAVAARGHYAYLGSPYWKYFRIVDVSDPAHPQPRGELTGLLSGSAIALYENFAIVASRNDGFFVVNIAEPDNPTLVGVHGFAGHPSDLAVYAHYAVVPSGTVTIVDLTYVMDLHVVGSVHPPGGATGIGVTGHYACTTASDTFNVIDLADPTQPTVVGSLQLGRSLRGVAASGDMAFLGTGEGFYVVDISDPATPQLVADVPDASNCQGISAVGSHVYVCSDHKGVMIYDASDPANPIQIGGQDTPDYAYSVAVTPDYTCIADGHSEFQVMHTQCEEEGLAAGVAVGSRDRPLFRLGEGRPDPFHASTVIDFALGAPGHIALEVFEPSGRLVRTLARGAYDAGTWQVTWDGRTDRGATAPAGVYFYRLTQGPLRRSGRLVLTR